MFFLDKHLLLLISWSFFFPLLFFCPGEAPHVIYCVYNKKTIDIRYLAKFEDARKGHNEIIQPDSSYCGHIRTETPQKPSVLFGPKITLKNAITNETLLILVGDEIDKLFKRISKYRYRLDVN